MPMLERAGKPRLHYLVDDFTDPWKPAPTIVLQHGYGRSGRFWYAWVPYLARYFRVVRPDWRGFGASARDFDLASGITVEAFVEDTADLVRHLGGGPVHYCGESLAGTFGFVLAAEHPDLVATLTALAAPLKVYPEVKEIFAFGHASWQEALRAMGARGWADAANGATRFPPGTDPGLLGWYADEMGGSSVEAMVALSELMLDVDATPWLPRISAPVLGLYAAHPTVTIQSQEGILRERIRDLSIVHLPSTKHMIQHTHVAACARQLLYFAARHAGIACDEP